MIKKIILCLIRFIEGAIAGYSIGTFSIWITNPTDNVQWLGTLLIIITLLVIWFWYTLNRNYINK